MVSHGKTNFDNCAPAKKSGTTLANERLATTIKWQGHEGNETLLTGKTQVQGLTSDCSIIRLGPGTSVVKISWTAEYFGHAGHSAEEIRCIK